MQGSSSTVWEDGTSGRHGVFVTGLFFKRLAVSVFVAVPAPAGTSLLSCFAGRGVAVNPPPPQTLERLPCHVVHYHSISVI